MDWTGRDGTVRDGTPAIGHPFKTFKRAAKSPKWIFSFILLFSTAKSQCDMRNEEKTSDKVCQINAFHNVQLTLPLFVLQQTAISDI